MRKIGKRILAFILAIVVVAGVFSNPLNVEAATVKLNKTKLVMDKGTTYRLKLSGNSKKITWTSSKNSVVKVASNGRLTAKKKGKAVITAKVGKKKYQCIVAVETPKISQKSVSLYVNKTVTLKMNQTVRKAAWSSSDKSVATVNSKGVVKGKKAGKAVITAKVGKKSYTCKVTVIKKKSTAEKEAEAVLKLINKERKKEGLPALKLNKTLMNAAIVRAHEIEKSFSHTRPDGTSCFSILNAGKYKVNYSMAGENIAAGYTSAEAVMEGWMNSPGHRANILQEGYNEVGIGYYYDKSSTYGYHWVQLFIKSR